MKKIYVDRSRVESHQRCARLRFLEYHQNDIGITSKRKPLPLAVGSSTHVGLATLLEEGQKLYASTKEPYGITFTSQLRSLEDYAVKSALADFAQFQAQLDIDAAEQYAMEGPALDDPELRAKMAALVAKGRSDFDIYLYREQAALVEALVRAYARRRLLPLLEQYEVLEVEREGQWLLSDWQDAGTYVRVDCENKCGMWNGSSFDEQHPWPKKCPGCQGPIVCDSEYAHEIWFMSRPDALLLERQSRELYILSYKTAAKWDRRKAEDAKRDMQGLSEGVEVEKRLGEWWQLAREGNADKLMREGCSVKMNEFLRVAPAAPRIMGIRYEYLLKGDRWTDKDLTARLGIETRSQRSPLVRAYKNDGMAAGDEQFNVSWDFVKETGETSKLYYKNWRSAAVWESMPIEKWINMLDQTAEVMGEDGTTSRGWGGPAQATGFLTAHPLDELFIPPIIQFRNEDDLRDLVDQLEHQEQRVAEGVASVNAASDEGERRHMLNVHFPQSRRACEYPSTCQFVKVCYGGEDIRRDPLGSGLYKIRSVNHPIENQKEAPCV